MGDIRTLELQKPVLCDWSFVGQLARLSSISFKLGGSQPEVEGYGCTLLLLIAYYHMGLHNHSIKPAIIGTQVALHIALKLFTLVYFLLK